MCSSATVVNSSDVGSSICSRSLSDVINGDAGLCFYLARDDGRPEGRERIREHERIERGRGMPADEA